MQPQSVLMPFRANQIQLNACAGLDLIRLWEATDPAEVLRTKGPEVRALANTGESIVDAKLLDQLPNLEIIVQFGVGYDSVDVAEAVRRGIVVTNTAGANEEEVADTAFGLLLMTVRELGQAEQYLRAGRWPAEGPYPLTPSSVQGRSLGLLGMGNIGQAVARRATAFGMAVAYHARSDRGLEYQYFPTLLELADAVDTLVVAAPGGPATRHIVNKNVLAALGPEGVLINVARGTLVDEAALAEALRTRQILAAGLDVYENEPIVPPELLALDNAVLVPHVGSASAPTRAGMAERAVQNLTTWFARGTAPDPVPESRPLISGG